MPPAGDAHAEGVARVLLDEAPIGAVQGPQGGGAHGGQIVDGAVGVTVADGAGVGGDAAGEDVEQGRLARAGLADDGEHFAGPQCHLHVVECYDRAEA